MRCRDIDEIFRHCGCDVVTLSVDVVTLTKILSDLAQCCDIRVVMSRLHYDVATLLLCH